MRDVPYCLKFYGGGLVTVDLYLSVMSLISVRHVLCQRFCPQIELCEPLT